MNSPDVPAIIMQEQGAPTTPGVQQPTDDEAMRALIEDIARRLQTDPAYRERARQLMQEQNWPVPAAPQPAAPAAPGPGSQNEFVLQRLMALLTAR